MSRSVTARPPRAEREERYTRTAILLHWTIAALILVNLPLGLICHLFETPFEQDLMNLHKPIGITVLGLSLARLVWRLMHHAPPLPREMPGRERVAAYLVHWGLYALMIAVPLTGWWCTSAFPGRHPTVWFGLVVPYLPVEGGMPNAVRAHDVHSWLAIALALIAAAHVAAALRHHWLLRDGLLDRMWPRILHRRG